MSNQEQPVGDLARGVLEGTAVGRQPGVIRFSLESWRPQPFEIVGATGRTYLIKDSSLAPANALRMSRVIDRENMLRANMERGTAEALAEVFADARPIALEVLRQFAEGCEDLQSFEEVEDDFPDGAVMQLLGHVLGRWSARRGSTTLIPPKAVEPAPAPAPQSPWARFRARLPLIR